MSFIKRFISTAVIIYISVLTGCESSSTGGTPATEMDDGRSSDYFIKSLSFSDGILKYPFNSEDWINYLEVPYTTESISVTAAANHPWSEIFIGDEKLYDNSSSSPVTLNVGTNTIAIKVIAEDGQELIYTIYVTRCSENYTVAKLSRLSISGVTLTPEFDVSGSNRNFTARTTASVISLNAVPAVESEGAETEVKVNNIKISDTSAISLKTGINTIKVKGIAPDGKTEDTYTINIIRQTESTTSSKLATLSIAGGNFNTDFDPAIIAYSIDVSSTMNPVNLSAVAESANAAVSIKLNGTNVTNPSSILLPPGVMSVITVTVTASGGGSTTYTINANSLQGSDNANLAGITVMMGSKSYRPLYPGSFTRGSSYHNPEQAGFSSTVNEYCTVIYGFNSIKVTVTAEDSTVKRINFAADGTAVSSDFSSGIASANIQMKYGQVTRIDITVVAGDDTTRKTYTVYAKLLNIDEFYWGIYAPSLDKSKSGRWEPKPGAGGSKSVNGLISGKMNWSITLSPTSTIALTNYNDGKLGFKYNDGGFIADGTQEAKLDGVATKDGYNCTKPGTTFYVKTPEGENVATLGYHIKVDGGETVEAPDSYTDITYMEITDRQIFKTSKPYPFSDSYDWSTSWSEGQ